MENNTTEKTAKKKKIDVFQRAAIDSKINTVVSAGAGSGKTTVLSERFLNLLMEHPDWKVDQILTLTFTKKATVEMSSRIYKVLKEKAPDKAADFFKSNIKTLDSYCNSVAKLGARYYGISPDFTQDEDTIKAQISAQALPFILKHRDNPAIKVLAKTKDLSAFANDLLVNPILKCSTISEPIDFDKELKNQINEIVNVWNKKALKVEECIGQIKTAREELVLGKTYKLLEELDRKFNVEGLVDYFKIDEQIVFNADYSHMKDFVTSAHNLAHINLKGATTVESLTIIIELLKNLRELVDSLIPVVDFVYGMNLIKELIPLLKEFQEIANNLKRSSSCLSFADIANMAVCVLRDYPEIRQIEKEKYKAIMIDEFQDNNSMQKDLLFLISEKLDCCSIGIPGVENLCEEKLFFVGDEKQSIYRFRGGDVSVFRGLSKDFSEGNLTMSINYRSNQALIAAFNTIFGGIKYPLGEVQKKILPSVFYNEIDEGDMQIPDYEAIYHEVLLSESAKEEVENTKDLEKIYKPKVHVALYDGELELEDKLNYSEKEEAEAEWVAEKIEELIDSGVKPTEIAILMRTYGLQATYERILLKHGIPYDSEKISGFFNDGPVNDIVTYLRLVAYQEETDSYAQVLSSPFVNLSIPEIEAVLTMGGDFIPFDLKALEVIAEESHERFIHAREFYTEVCECSKTKTICELISKLWYEGGYHYETMWNKTVLMYSKQYDFMFELARRADADSINLASFLDSLDEYYEENSKLEDLDIPLEQSSGVHILSIFKSKGLEYDYVFVCATHKESKKNSNTGSVYCSKEFKLTVNTPSCTGLKGSGNYFYKKCEELNKQQSYAELRRLTYVALTRAKKELFITCGCYKPKENAINDFAPGKAVDSIIEVLMPLVEFYKNEENKSCSPFDYFEIKPMPKAYKIKEGDTKRRNTETAKQELISNIKKSNIYNSMEVIEKDIPAIKYMSPSHLHEADDENNSVAVKVEGEIPFNEINKLVWDSIPEDQKDNSNGIPAFGFNNFGTIAHSYLESAIKGDFKPKIEFKDITGLNNNKEKLAVLEKCCEEMANGFLNSDLGKRAVDSAWKKPEYEFRCKMNNKIIKGIIDLVFEEKDGSFTIVDYKTNRSIKPEIYFEQLACYRRAFAKMINVKDESCIKCKLYYLRFGKEIDITQDCNKVNIEEVIDRVTKEADDQN